MKVLFICRSNVARSQIAEGLFNKLSKDSTAASAGTHVGEKEGTPIKKFEDIVTVMNEVGIDLTKSHAKQLTKEMFDEADVVVSLTDKKHLPDFAKGEKVRFWKLIDMKNKPIDFHREMRDKIKVKVEKLISDLE